MPKGKNVKPAFVKANEQPRNNEVANDDLSPVDVGHDFVKAGERAQIANLK